MSAFTGRTLEQEIRLTGDDAHVAVEVHNTGTIQSEILPRIFEPLTNRRGRA
jgi:hypothetical protein